MRPIPFILFSAAGLAALAATPAPEQPLPFSHKTHRAVAKLECRDCHPDPAKFGEPMGFPAASKCMVCHNLIATDKPAIRKLAQLAASREPIPWVRVYALRDFVFFDHRFHLLNSAKCADCHGPVADHDVTADELNSTKMPFCQACHQKMQARNGCNTCHDNQ